MQEDYRTLVIKNIFKDITNLKSVIKDTKNAQELLEKDDDLENLENHINSTKKIVRNLKKSVDKIHNYFDSNYKKWTKNSPKKDDDKDDKSSRRSKSSSLKKTVKDKPRSEEDTNKSDAAELPPDVSLNDSKVEEETPKQQLDDSRQEDKEPDKRSTEKADHQQAEDDLGVKDKTDDTADQGENERQMQNEKKSDVSQNEKDELEEDSRDMNQSSKNNELKESRDKDTEKKNVDIVEESIDSEHSDDKAETEQNVIDEVDDSSAYEPLTQKDITEKDVENIPEEKLDQTSTEKDHAEQEEKLDTNLPKKDEISASHVETELNEKLDETEKEMEQSVEDKDNKVEKNKQNDKSEPKEKTEMKGKNNISKGTSSEKEKETTSKETSDKNNKDSADQKAIALEEEEEVTAEKEKESDEQKDKVKESEEITKTDCEGITEKESEVITGKENEENKEKDIRESKEQDTKDSEKDDATALEASKDMFDDDPSIEILNDTVDSVPKETIKTEPAETFGKIKLVCLSKLIDPIHKTPKVEDSIVILSDSDDEPPIPTRKRTRNTSIESHKNNNNKASPKLYTSKSILKVRNLDTTEDVEKSPTPKKVKFADKDKMILSKIRDSDDSSDSDSEQCGSRGKSNPKKKESTKKEATITPDGLDEKFSLKSYIKLPKIPAEKLKAEYMKKMEKLELKRLTDMKSLRKRSRANNETSSSDESTTKPAAKKKSERSEKKVTHLKNSDSSDSSDVEDNPKIDSLPKTVDPNTPDMNGTDSEMEFQNDMDSTILDNIVASDYEKSDSEKETEECSEKKSSDSDDENNTQNGDEDEQSEENSKRKEKSDEENEIKKTKKSRKESDDSDSDDDDEDKKKGSSSWKRDKLLTEKLSDDSESDIFESVKKISGKAQAKSTTKRKPRRVIHDSDSEFESKNEESSEAEEEEEEKKESSSDSEAKKEAAKKKSRKRIKKVNESSSDDEDKSTRKQIRKVLNRDSLAETTKQAEKEEAERKARIAERQKKYNDIFEADKLEKSSLNKVVLDFNEETNEELLEVHKDLVKHLKPHQGKGVQFMWDACFESIDRAKNTAGSGCILAHCMGLGKTLQVITLSHTLLTNSEKTGVKKVLVVCPLSTVLNWVSEFKKWLPSDEDFEVYDLVSYKQNRERLFMTSEWHKNGGVLVLGYDMFRNLSNDANKRITKKMRLDFKRNLVDPGPDLVVCDEGHLLKNEKTSLSISMNKLKTVRRIVLTGTPLQNNLKEYWCMVQFVKPNLLGTYKEYLNRFVNPITNGQYTDSTPHDIQIMRKRSHVLHKLLDGIVQRRDYSVLAPFLPPKHEYILFVSLTETQVKLYSHYMKEFAQQKTSTRSSFLFVDFQELQRICTHPRVLLDKSIQNKIAQEKKDWENDDESEGSIKDFIDDGSDSASDSTPNSSSGEDDEKPEVQKNKYRRRTRATAEIEGPEVLAEDEVDDGPQEWWRQYTQGDELDNIIHSGKLHLLFEILHQCELIGDKVLVFSQSLYSLNVIEYFLSKIDEASQNGNSELVGGYNGSWALGLDYFRLDGSSSCDNRAAWCKTFNNPDNTRARLFLISTKAGGLGINLVAANRVIIFDVSWNPSHDIQSIYRVYRFGQLKPSYIYRFVTMGTMEMKIYERQVTKQAISKRVIDEQQIDRHYNQNDLQELYKFDPQPDETRPTPLVPKDILLGELLQSHNTLIYKYHEHQSLLENKEDEVLDEAERKAAWEEFENEKKARHLNTGAYTGNINQIPMGSIVTALTNIIKREQPTFTINEINGVMPQLVQELNGQMRVGDFTMYNKIISEIKNVQTQVQQQKLQEYYQMQQQQQAIKMFQKYQQQFQSSGVTPTETANFVQQWQNAAAASSNPTRRNVPTIDPDVIRLDD